jgi:hypothetical protein
MPAPAKTPPTFFSPQVLEARRFYLDLAPASSKPLAVVCGGWERCAPDYAIHRPTFPYYSIEFVVRGKGTLSLAGRDFAVLPGVVFSYGPGIAQKITTDAADPLVKYFVDFTGRRRPMPPISAAVNTYSLNTCGYERRPRLPASATSIRPISAAFSAATTTRRLINT